MDNNDLENWHSHSVSSWPNIMAPVPVAYLKLHEDAQAPQKSGEDELGIDIRCISYDEFEDGCVDNSPPLTNWETPYIKPLPEHRQDRYLELPPGMSATLRTGLSFAIPRNYGFLLRDRSGLGMKCITHTAGVIDSTYRGEWFINLVNLCGKTYMFRPGDKICQAIVVPRIPVVINEVDSLDGTSRGTKGFGSSGR